MMERMKELAGWDYFAFLRWLVIAELVSLFISTSLTSVVEVVLFAAALLGAGRLRDRAVALGRQPLMVMSLVFCGMLLLGLLYGPAPLAEKLAAIKGWRKLLLLPLALLLFDEARWKARATWAVVAAAAAYVLYSFYGLWSNGPFVVVHNHATQGMFFAVAAFAAAVLSLPGPASVAPAWRWPLALLVLLLVANIIFVTPGRSGYLALLILAAVAPLMLFRGWTRLGLAAGGVLAILVLLALSSAALERISVGLQDMHRYEEAEQLTDMGIRMVMWTNTLQIVRDRPIFGHGLGGLREAYRKQVEGVAGWRGTVVDDSHNQYLKIAAELGLVGLLVFLMFIAAFFRQQVPLPYRLLGLGVLLAWCATSFFSGHFNTSGEGRFLMLWAGIQLAQGAFSQGRENEATAKENGP